MARTPKGTVIRFDPDFRPLNMMYGSDSVNLSSSDTAQDIGLYNNATDGKWLTVWDCLAILSPNPSATRGSQYILWDIQTTKPSGSPQPGTPLVPTASVGPGIIFDVHNSTGVTGNPYWATVDGGPWQWPHSFPMCQLPPGYSLIVEFVTNLSSGFSTCSATFMWQWGVPLP